MASYYQGVRAKRILSQLNLKDNVVKLRHANSEEYKEIFGQNYQLPMTNDVNIPRRLRPRRKINMSDEDYDDVENHDCNQPRYSAEPELVAASEISNVSHNRRAVRSRSLSVLSSDANGFPSLRKTQSALLFREGLLKFHVSSSSENHKDVDDVHNYSKNQLYDSQEVNSKLDEFKDFNVCHIRREVRSWSLSDLTHDLGAYSNRPLQKYQSAPLIAEELPQLCNSPSIINVLPLAENDPRNNEYFNSSTDSDIEHSNDYGDLREGRKRRHVPEPESWKRSKAKMRRMHGEEYLGYSKPRGGKFQQDTLRPAREIGERCQSSFCKKSKLRACSQVPEDTRRKIHESFWKDMNWEQRKIYVSSLVTRSDTIRKTKSTSRREGTFAYFLPIKKDCSVKVQVCRQMFLNTVSLGSFTVQSWVKRSEYGMTPSNNIEKALKATTRNPEVTRKVLTLNNFLDWLPKMPSHYARKDTSKLYVEPLYNSLAHLYNAYKTYCTENEEPQVSRFTFEKKFHEKNLSLYVLKKDMCDVCSAHKAGNLDEAEHQVHIIKKDRARKEKSDDKVKAAGGEFILLSMDLQAVKLCPYLTASALYFKTKLTCHNFTVFNLITKHCTCYWFDETAADLKASTFTTCIIDYIERHCMSQNLPIVIYSDGCTYQNRNAILANALFKFSKANNINIYQKFLEPGHTQMECDSVHSAIERKLKNREIHLPSNYITITKEARKDPPYETVDIRHDFVKDYTLPENMAYKSIRPGRKAGDPQVVDIKAIHYNTMTIDVKLDFDSEWMPLPQRPKILQSDVIYHQLHQNRIPIAATKYKHLQELKAVLPIDCHAFYDALPYI